MTEWIREGIEGRSLKATLRLYLLGLLVLAPAAAALALVFGGQASFVVTPLLVLILVAVELTFCYRAKLRKGLAELLRKLRLRTEYNENRIEDYAVTTKLSPLQAGRDVVNFNRGQCNTEIVAIGQLTISIGHSEETIDELVQKALYGRDMSIRASAVKDLGFRDDPRALDLLISALQERDSSVRDSAAVALGSIGDLRAVEPLLTALGDEDASVRSSAIKALRQLSSLSTARAAFPPEVIKDIRRVLSTSQSDEAQSKSKAASKPIKPVRKRA